MGTSEFESWVLGEGGKRRVAFGTELTRFAALSFPRRTSSSTTPLSSTPSKDTQISLLSLAAARPTSYPAEPSTRQTRRPLSSPTYCTLYTML